MPSGGPQRGQKCYVTPEFSGIPNAKRGEQKISNGPKQWGTKSEVAAYACDGLTPLTAKKIDTTRRLFCYTHVLQKKKYTNYNIHQADSTRQNSIFEQSKTGGL